MAKKPTEKQLYKLKNEWLGQFFEEVKPKEFYRAVFPEGSFERAGHFEDGKANGIITIVENDKAKNRIVFDDLSVIDEVKGAEFAVMSPVAYSGRNRTAANARWLYGIAIDLDGVEMPQLRDVFHQMNHDIIPKCTYCINSGHGLHLYYLLEKPVPLYKHLQDKLREFKYKLKNEWLGQFFEEVKPKEFYRAVFPEGSFERAGHFEDGKANGIITIVENDKAKNRIVFDDLSVIDEVKGAEFAVMSPVAYSGRNRTAANARWLYGIAIDLDGVEMPQLRDVFHQMNHDIIPKCTYCINSGHGLHLYYLLEKPVPLYKHLQDKLREFKYELIAKVWNRYTSTFTEREQVQYQGIFQGFRMVGTQSKLGKRYPVKAFETGERVTIEYLNGYLMDKSKAVTDFHYKSDLSLAEARKKYPEWYEKRIVQGERRERWHIKRDLYDWWLRKIKEGASVGHRYSCLCVLASYAVKCDIPEDELFTDAFSLLQFLDDMSDDEHNRFTKRDIMDAMQFYQENYVTYSRSEAERVSAIPMPANKRNYQKQADHLEEARAIRDIRMKRQDRDWREGNGRPKGSGEKSKIVEEWQRQHPDGKKADCIRETGLSKPTVYKWWK